MLVIRRPGEFQTGSIESKSNGDDEATTTWQTLPYDFAISVHEVTMEQFRRFRPDANFALDVADNPQCPANKVSFNDAIKYCEWLNDQEGIPAEERCYDPDAATVVFLPVSVFVSNSFHPASSNHGFSRIRRTGCTVVKRTYPTLLWIRGSYSYILCLITISQQEVFLMLCIRVGQ